MVDYRTMKRHSDYNVVKAYLDTAWGAVFYARGILRNSIDDKTFEDDLKDVQDELERINFILTKLALDLERIYVTLVAESKTTGKKVE